MRTAFPFCVYLKYFPITGKLRSGKSFFTIYDTNTINKKVRIAIALYLVSEGLPFENVWVLLAIRTFLLMVFVSYIVKNDFPLRSLPVIGKYFR